ncbi:MAG: hypothetical protein JSS72_06695 [Armatimonadetes bacterium]|nr:hypothetical protein [Armatimonadota bacterium]
MVEFGIRLLISSLLIFSAGLFDVPQMSAAWPIALAVSVLGFVQYKMDERGYRNTGVAGYMAAFDSVAISMALASFQALRNFGFLCIIPLAIATKRRGAQPVLIAPLAVAGMCLAHSIFYGDPIPSPILLIQMAGVLTIAILFPTPKPARYDHNQPMPIAPALVLTEEVGAPMDEFLDLRENFRQLKDDYNVLERKYKGNRYASLLEELRSSAPSEYGDFVAERIRKVFNVETVRLFTVVEAESMLKAEGMANEANPAILHLATQIDLRTSVASIAHALTGAIKKLMARDDARKQISFPLVDRGRLVGVINFADEDGQKLDKFASEIEHLTPGLGRLVGDWQRRNALERRAREGELLYELTTVTSGATTESTLAARLAADLKESTNADNAAIYLVDGEDLMCLASAGENLRLIDAMSFGDGPGLVGWTKAGRPELAIFVTAGDIRCAGKEALLRRVGSYCLVPIETANGFYGFMTLATRIGGGLEARALETLRIAAGEFGRALDRIKNNTEEDAGIMTQTEFANRIRKGKGFLITLDPIRREHLEAYYGKPALLNAMRKLAIKMRSGLPAGAAICRRQEGGFLVYIPRIGEARARAWANEAAATASLISLYTPDGTQRIPLGLRAKVSKLGAEAPEIHDETAETVEKHQEIYEKLGEESALK